jgi:hypothetical protein
MEPPWAIRQSPRGRTTHRLSFARSRTMAICLCIVALGVPTAGTCASTPSPVPLFVETPNDIPPAIAQAFSSPEMSKQWVRRHRSMGLNPAALEAMKLARKDSKQDISLDLFDASTRTLVDCNT